MQFLTLAAIGFAAAVGASPAPYVTDKIPPPTQKPPQCQDSYPSSFTITTVNATTASQKSKRATTKTYTLEGGVIKDQDGNVGYIASNSQFQFANNNPNPQPGAQYTSGFSVCPNHTLALGDTTIFRSCNSGSFNNLYYKNTAAQCSDVFLEAIDAGSKTSGGAPSSVAQKGDSQPTAAPSAGPSVKQINDQQPQAPTSAAGSVAQIGDQQPQAPTSAAGGVKQIGDQQPQAPTSAAGGIKQIGDQQPQAPTSAAGGIKQIGDQQPQAPTSAAGGISQIGDQQPQAPTSAAGAVSQIGDQQPQAPTKAANASSPYQTSYTGGAALATAAPLAIAAAGAFIALL